MSLDSAAPAASWLALTRMELRMGLRSAGFRLLALAAFLLGYANGDAGGSGVGLSAYATGEAAWRYLGFMTVIWMSVTAIRETTLRTNDLISCKPQPSEQLALTKFLGAFLQLMIVLAAMFLGAAVSRAFAGGSLSGAEVYVIQYLRAAGVLFFGAAASYALALLFDSAIAGSLVGLYWILTLAGKPFLAKFYFPSYSQNLPGYVVVGMGILCLTFWLHRRTRRGGIPPALWVRVGTPLFLTWGGWLIWTAIRDGHDPEAIRHPVMDLIAEQDAEMGSRAPGFVLPDQYGRQTGLSDFDGKILVIALWSPSDQDSVYLLDRLAELQRKYGSKGVQPIAICLGDDVGAAATFARGNGIKYPVLEDWGTYNAPVKSDISPVATAYRANILPKVVVTDRRRRSQSNVWGSTCYEGQTLEKLIADRLEAEPK